MSTKYLSNSEIPSFLEHLAGEYQVIAPTRRDEWLPGGGSKYSFEVLNEGPGQLAGLERAVLDYPITMQDPKKFFFPAKEELLRFHTDEKGQIGKTRDMAEEMDLPPRALVGLHPCDVAALEQLDIYFASDQIDPYYHARRSGKLLIVAVACLSPCSEECFCGSMNTCQAKEGFDLLLTRLGEGFAVVSGSEVGEAWLEKASFMQKLDKGRNKLLADVEGDIDETFSATRMFDVAKIPDNVRKGYRDPVWHEVAEKCLGCGSCNLVCPTCYCFDVIDDVSLDLQNASKLRAWDGCMLRQFAEIGGGENFRGSREARLRHRISRKGAYLHQRYGRVFCVGCGRCATACLVDISPATIFRTLEENHGH